MMDSNEQWFYNPATGEVAQGLQHGWEHRMGPYETQADAQQALKTAAERTAAADAYDEEDDNWGVAPSWEK
ncbi:MAG: hypothetical protein Q4A92_07165 [Corynebacterium sp.]|nr:hypothetical protein [Corynebacterium sp.]